MSPLREPPRPCSSSHRQISWNAPPISCAECGAPLPRELPRCNCRDPLEPGMSLLCRAHRKLRVNEGDTTLLAPLHNPEGTVKS
jgi:hypothetical protein